MSFSRTKEARSVHGEGGLLQLFRSLAQPHAEARWADLSGTQASPGGPLYICKDSSGRPAFLLPGSVTLPPVRLENLEVRHRIRCNVLAGAQPIPIPSATLISCLTDDKALQTY